MPDIFGLLDEDEANPDRPLGDKYPIRKHKFIIYKNKKLT